MYMYLYSEDPRFSGPLPLGLTTNVSSTASVSRPTHPRTYSPHASGARSQLTLHYCKRLLIIWKSGVHKAYTLPP
jgi:hypothetical protein